jgi:hypothetical protein
LVLFFSNHASATVPQNSSLLFFINLFKNTNKKQQLIPAGIRVCNHIAKAAPILLYLYFNLRESNPDL